MTKEKESSMDKLIRATNEFLACTISDMLDDESTRETTIEEAFRDLKEHAYRVAHGLAVAYVLQAKDAEAEGEESEDAAATIGAICEAMSVAMAVLKTHMAERPPERPPEEEEYRIVERWHGEVQVRAVPGDGRGRARGGPPLRRRDSRGHGRDGAALGARLRQGRRARRGVLPPQAAGRPGPTPKPS